MKLKNSCVATSLPLAISVLCCSMTGVVAKSNGKNERRPQPTKTAAASGYAVAKSQLAAKAVKEIVSTSEPITLLVTLKNTTTKPVYYYDSPLEFLFRVEGRNAQGKTLFQTRYYKGPSRRMKPTPSVPAGQEVQFQLDI